MHDFVNNRLFNVDLKMGNQNGTFSSCFTIITVLLPKRKNMLCKLIKNYPCNIILLNSTI